MPEYREIGDRKTTVRLLGPEARGGDMTLFIRRGTFGAWLDYTLSADADREIASAMLLLLGCAVMIEDVEDETQM